MHTGAGELNILVCVALDVFPELAHNQRARCIMDALGHRDHAAAEALVGGLHIGEERLEHEDALRKVDQVRSVIMELSRHRRGRGQESGVPAHDNYEVDTGQRCVIEVGTEERLGYKACRRWKSWRVIIAHPVSYTHLTLPTNTEV